MLGELTTYEIDQVLENQVVGRIGCQAKGQVYIVPITFAFDGHYIYAHSPEGLKIQMMRKNPKVCFEVDEIKNVANWKSVVVQGEYEELIGEPAREALDFFVKKMMPLMKSATSIPSHGMIDFHQKNQSAVKSVIFRIKVHEKTGRFEKTM